MALALSSSVNKILSGSSLSIPPTVARILRGTEPDPDMIGIEDLAERQVEKEESGGNPLFTVLEWMGRPQAAVAGIIKDAIDGGDFSPLDRVQKAFTGDESYRTSDIMREAGIPVDSYIAKGAAFVGDILTDPLMYLNLGKVVKTLASGQKLARLGSKEVKQAVSWFGKKTAKLQSIADIDSKQAKENFFKLLNKKRKLLKIKGRSRLEQQKLGIINYKLMKSIKELAGEIDHKYLRFWNEAPPEKYPSDIFRKAAENPFLNKTPVRTIQLIHGQHSTLSRLEYHQRMVQKVLDNPNKFPLLYERITQGNAKFWKNAKIQEVTIAKQYNAGERNLIALNFWPLAKLGSLFGKDLTNINVLGSLNKHIGAGLAHTVGNLADSIGDIEMMRHINRVFKLSSGIRALDYYASVATMNATASRVSYEQFIKQARPILDQVTNKEEFKKVLEFMEGRGYYQYGYKLENVDPKIAQVAETLEQLTEELNLKEMLAGTRAIGHEIFRPKTTSELHKAFQTYITKSQKDRKILQRHYENEVAGMMTAHFFNKLPKARQKLISLTMKESGIELNSPEHFKELYNQVRDHYIEYTSMLPLKNKRSIHRWLWVDEGFIPYGSSGIKDLSKIPRGRAWAEENWVKQFEKNLKKFFVAKHIAGPKKLLEKYNKLLSKKAKGVINTEELREFERYKMMMEMELEQAASMFGNDKLTGAMGYVPRYLSKEGRDLLAHVLDKTTLRDGESAAAHFLRASKGRNFKNMDMKEVNELINNGSLDSGFISSLITQLKEVAKKDPKIAKRLEFMKNNDIDFDLFFPPERLYQAFAIRWASGIRAITHSEIINTMTALLGRAVRGADDLRLGETVFSFTKRGIKGYDVGFWRNLTPEQDAFIGVLEKEQWLGIEGRAKGRELFIEIGKDPVRLAEGLAIDVPMWAIPIQAKEFIDRMSDHLRNPQTMNAFVRTWDKITNFWKTITLVPFPGYHSRNAIGSFWQNMLAGINVSDYLNSSRIVATRLGQKAKLTGGMWKDLKNQFITLPDKTKLSLEEVYDLYVKNGGAPFFGGELPTMKRGLSTFGKSKIKNIGSAINPHNVIIKTGAGVGRQVEDVHRLSLFINRLKKGYTPSEAGMSVKKYHFDYSELTLTEKNKFRRLLPFYSWTRKNIPLQLEMMIRQPGKFSALNHFIRDFWDKDSELNEQDRKLLPGFVSRRYGVVSRLDKDTGDLYVNIFQSWIPAMDLIAIQAPVQTGIEMANPLLKIPTALYFNRDPFTGKPIEEPKGQQETIFPGITKEQYGIGLEFPVPRKLAFTARSFSRGFAEVERLASPNPYKETPQFNIRLKRALLGFKEYKFNLQRLKKRRKFDIAKRSGQLKRQLHKAKQVGDKEMVRWFKDMIADAQEEKRQINSF